MVGVTGIEPVTPSMSTKCSPAELHAHCRAVVGFARLGAARYRPKAVRITGLSAKDKMVRRFGPKKAESLSSRHQTLDLGHQIAQVKGLGQHLGVLWGLRFGAERNGGKSGDEHDLQRRIEFRSAPRQLDSIHFRHDDIRQQNVEDVVLKLCMGKIAPSERRNIMSGVFQRFRQETAHRFIVFRK